MLNNLKKISAYILLLCLSFIICLSFSQNPINKYYFSDASVYQYVGKLITEGYIPYRDVWDHKGPFVYLWYAIGYTIHPMVGIYYIEVIYLFLIMSLAYSIAKYYLNRLYSLLVITVLFLNIQYRDIIGNTETLGLLPLLYITHIVETYTYNFKLKKIDCFFIGIICSFLFLIKPLYLVSPLIFCLYIMLTLIRNKDVKEIRKLFLYGGIGCLIVLSPILVWLYLNDAIKDFWLGYIDFNIMYTIKHNHAGYGTLYGTFMYFLKQPVILITLASIIYLLSTIQQYENQYKKIIYLSINTFVISFFVLVLPKNSYAHYLVILYPLILYILVLVVKNIKSDVMFISIMECLIILLSYGFYSNVLNMHDNNKIRDGQYRQIANIISSELKENETFASFLTDCAALHLYSERKSASKYPLVVYFARLYPEKTKEEFSKIKPKIIVSQETEKITIASKNPPIYNIEKNIHLSELFNLDEYELIYSDYPYVIYKIIQKNS